MANQINFEKYKENISPLKIFIRNVKIKGDVDSVLFGGYHGDLNEEQSLVKMENTQVKYQLNSFHFEYVSPLFEQQINLEYTTVNNFLSLFQKLHQTFII